MSLEQALGGLEDAVTKLTNLLEVNNALTRQILEKSSTVTLQPGETNAPAEATAPTETKPPARARPSRAKTATVVQPPVESSTDDDGFGDDADDGFGDDAEGEEAAGEFVKNYNAEDAKNSLKALRDGLKITKPFTEDQARDTAKKAMVEAGFAKLDTITDEAANGVVAIAVKYAQAAGVEAEKNFKTRAAQYGTEIA